MSDAIAPKKKMGILKKILLVLLLGIIGLAIVIATRPAEFKYERSMEISAAPDVVFPLINDLRQWQYWSPWEKLDTKMQKKLEGPEVGPGSSFTWDGNSDVGAGKSTIVDSKANESVSMKLEMFKPMAGTNQVMFKLAPTATGTKVSWIMEGNNNFIGKAFSLFINCDKMCGDSFMEGLGNLNKLALAKAKK